jgi:hypothetical protein
MRRRVPLRGDQDGTGNDLTAIAMMQMKPPLRAPYDVLHRDAAAFIPDERLITVPCAC